MWLHQQLYGDWLSHARKYNERVLLGANPSLAVKLCKHRGSIPHFGKVEKVRFLQSWGVLTNFLEMERFMNWWKGTIVFMYIQTK